MTRRRLVLVVLCPVAVVLGLGVILCATGCSYLTAVRARARIKREMLTERRAPPAGTRLRNNIPVTHLYGTPEEMGAQYGTLMKGALQALHTYIRSLLSEEDMARMRRQASRIEPALPEGIRAELRAAAKAAGIPYRDLATLNVIPRVRCSTLAVWGKATGGPMIVGRNSEYFSFGLGDRGSQVVVRHPKDGHATVSVGFIGMIGSFTGVNSKDVVYANLLALNARKDGMQAGGLPIQIALRLAAERSGTADEMVRALASQRHVIPMNVTVADPGGAAVVELGLDGHAVLRGDGVLAASNWFQTPALRSDAVHCERRSGLLAAAEAGRGRFSVEMMKRALHAARLDDLNIQVAIFEPGAQKMHLSVNRSPASAGPYTTFDFAELFARGPLEPEEEEPAGK